LETDKDPEFNKAILIDSGADPNTIRKEVAEKLGLEKIQVQVNPAETVNYNFTMEEGVFFEVKVGPVNTTIFAYVVETSPADVIFGGGFLRKYSAGYWMMVDEFCRTCTDEDKDKHFTQIVCALQTQKKLE